MPERLNRVEVFLSGKRHRLALRLHSLLPRRKSPVAIALAALLFVGSVALKQLSESWAEVRLPPFIFFYPSVVIASLIAGARAGIAVAVASVFVAWVWFFAPSHSFDLRSGADVLSLEIYAASSIFLALAVGFARYALDLAVASEELRDYDAQEAIHRIKNLLTVVQTIASGTLRDANDVEEGSQLIGRRISALAAAQDVLRKREEGPAKVDELVNAALGPFLPNPQITVKCGVGVMVPSRYVHGLTLALFELATNSAKYGALRSANGSISVNCKRGFGTFELRWVETSRSGHLENRSSEDGNGFGHKLIEAALRKDKGTAVLQEHRSDGVRATFCWPDQML